MPDEPTESTQSAQSAEPVLTAARTEEVPAAPERLQKCQRIFQIAALLREGHWSVQDLALRLYPTASVRGPGWSAIERAVQRDLTDLATLEPELEIVPGGKKPPRYRIPTHRSTLHPVEALALHAAARLTYHRANGQKKQHEAALRKLTDWLPDHLRPVMQRSLKNLGEKRSRSREDLNLEHASAAWIGAHPLRFEYRKPGGSGQKRTNIVETYIIEAHPQNLDLYVIGRETSFHRDVRTFKLSRMENLSVLRGEHYTIPDTFDPHEFFHAAWGVVGSQGHATVTIALRFRADAAYRILEGGYANMTEPYCNADGSIDTSIEAPLDSSGLPREVLPWILSFGPRVEVLGPPHIRLHWRQELGAALTQAQREPQVFAPQDRP